MKHVPAAVAGILVILGSSVAVGPATPFGTNLTFSQVAERGIRPERVLRSVRIAPASDSSVIVLEADGPLPEPRIGAVGNPPRIYLDFPGVTPATAGRMAGADPRVLRVRVALNRAQPLVTRVVIDLKGPAPHRIDSSERERGRLIVVVGQQPRARPDARPAGPTPRGEGQAAPPSPPAPLPSRSPLSSPAPTPLADLAVPDLKTMTFQLASPPPAPSAPARGESASARARIAPAPAFPSAGTVRAPAKDVATYLQRASSALDRLERLRPLLAALDSLATLSAEPLRAGVAEFTAIRVALARITPPQTLKPTHETLGAACTLGALAATTRLEGIGRGDAAGAWNAASAAAGTIMLLDRARAELGLPAVER